MTVKEYIEKNHFKGGEFITIVFDKIWGVESVNFWLTQTKLLKFDCKVLSQKVIRIIL